MKTLIILIAVVLFSGCMLYDYGPSGNTLVEKKWIEESHYLVQINNLDTNETRVIDLMPGSWSNFRVGAVILMEW